MKPFLLGGRISREDLLQVARFGRLVRLPPAARARIAAARRVVLRHAAGGEPIYGVNTGFGELASERISPENLERLQYNLIRSHASGVGEPLSPEQSRAMLLLRANELSRGHSGCRPELVDMLAEMLNRGVTPEIPSRGSVGASGDLAPQAHAALVLIGEGRARMGRSAPWGRPLNGSQALRAARLKPMSLEAKEGLSLVNGTQAMQAVGGLALEDAFRVLEAGDLAGAMSLEALKGTPVPFDARVNDLKPHAGQRLAAARLRALLKGSEIRESHRHGDPRVQDAYSLRCMPQVHGAAYDALEYASATLEVEMRSVTDNPVVVGGSILSGGNFHGQALALALDAAAIALTAAANISERRIFQLISGRELPPFLAEHPGLESGFMIPQVAAAALASENKGLAHPASADSIPTSGNKEDFVSMGMGAALKFERVVDNAAQIVAIELLAAAHGVEMRGLSPGVGVAEGLRRLRSGVPRTKGDVVFSEPMRRAKALVLGGAFAKIV